MPEQFCKIFRTSAPYGGVFLRSVVQVYYDRHKSAHESGKPPYTPGRLHDGCTGRIYWLRLCQPVHSAPAPLLRITGRTTTSIAPYGQATTQVFATNATFLHHMNKPFITADSTIRADVSARCIFTLTAKLSPWEMFTPLMTWIRGKKSFPGSAMHSPDFPDEKPRTLLHRYGNQYIYSRQQ
ncbi:Uncharacterised protein [Escherichia coli]|uniref:Uncharacterized protein n=1 Tax=Escherichia coli TaxID=562 RepID=A0A2X1KNF0_ECOLX|nr:Uncharacterised protein [Escherichia coli]